jgi:hypothetical protein
MFGKNDQQVRNLKLVHVSALLETDYIPVGNLLSYDRVFNFSDFVSDDNIPNIRYLKAYVGSSNGGGIGSSPTKSIAKDEVTTTNLDSYVYTKSTDRISKFGNDFSYLTFWVACDGVFFQNPALDYNQDGSVTINYEATQNAVIKVTGPGADAVNKDQVDFNGELSITITLDAARTAKLGDDWGFISINMISGGTELIPAIDYNGNDITISNPNGLTGTIYLTGPGEGTGGIVVSSDERPRAGRINYDDPRWNNAHTLFTDNTWSGWEPNLQIQGMRFLTGEDDGLMYFDTGGFQINAGVINEGQIIYASF